MEMSIRLLECPAQAGLHRTAISMKVRQIEQVIEFTPSKWLPGA